MSASAVRHAKVHTGLLDSPLSVEDAHRFVADPAAGAAVVFTGMVRDHALPDGASPDADDSAAMPVTGLDYEAYDEVARRELAALASDVLQRWPMVRAIWAEHRVGALHVGQIAVVVAVSSPHRAEAFEAAEHLIDTLKATVPIWKKEHWAGGGAHWPGTD